MLCIRMTCISQFLSEINPSLADQMFAEKELLTLQTGFRGMEEFKNVTS